MLSNNIGLYGTKILLEIFWDFVFFPIWWYTQGLFELSKKLLLFLNNQQKSLALFLWIKNIYKPMYAQKDWQGVLISIFMRLVLLIFKVIAMFFWLVLALFALVLWILTPLIIIYFIYFQLVRI